MTDHTNKLVRNSTTEFLGFTGQTGDQSIEARYEDNTVWLTQKLIAQLFAVDVRTVSKHLNGKVSAEMTKAHVENEFEKYRIVQDYLFESDFDRVIKQIERANRARDDQE